MGSVNRQELCAGLRAMLAPGSSAALAHAVTYKSVEQIMTKNPGMTKPEAIARLKQANEALAAELGLQGGPGEAGLDYRAVLQGVRTRGGRIGAQLERQCKGILDMSSAEYSRVDLDGLQEIAQLVPPRDVRAIFTDTDHALTREDLSGLKRSERWASLQCAVLGRQIRFKTFADLLRGMPLRLAEWERLTKLGLQELVGLLYDGEGRVVAERVRRVKELPCLAHALPCLAACSKQHQDRMLKDPPEDVLPKGTSSGSQRPGLRRSPSFRASNSQTSLQIQEKNENEEPELPWVSQDNSMASFRKLIGEFDEFGEFEIRKYFERNFPQEDRKAQWDQLFGTAKYIGLACAWQLAGLDTRGAEFEAVHELLRGSAWYAGHEKREHVAEHTVVLQLLHAGFGVAKMWDGSGLTRAPDTPWLEPEPEVASQQGRSELSQLISEQNWDNDSEVRGSWGCALLQASLCDDVDVELLWLLLINGANPDCVPEHLRAKSELLVTARSMFVGSRKSRQYAMSQPDATGHSFLVSGYAEWLMFAALHGEHDEDLLESTNDIIFAAKRARKAWSAGDFRAALLQYRLIAQQGGVLYGLAHTLALQSLLQGTDDKFKAMRENDLQSELRARVSALRKKGEKDKQATAAKAAAAKQHWVLARQGVLSRVRFVSDMRRLMDLARGQTESLRACGTTVATVRPPPPACAPPAPAPRGPGPVRLCSQPSPPRLAFDVAFAMSRLCWRSLVSLPLPLPCRRLVGPLSRPCLSSPWASLPGRRCDTAQSPLQVRVGIDACWPDCKMVCSGSMVSVQRFAQAGACACARAADVQPAAHDRELRLPRAAAG